MHAETRVTNRASSTARAASSPPQNWDMRARSIRWRPSPTQTAARARLRDMTPLFLTTLMLVQTINIRHSQRRRRRRLPRTKVSDPYVVETLMRGDAQLGGGGESRDLRVSGADSGTRAHPPPADALWDYPKYGAPSRRAPLFSSSKLRPPESGGALHAVVADGGAGSVARSQHVVADGTVALSILAFAEDGRTMVYAPPQRSTGRNSGSAMSRRGRPQRSFEVDQVLQRGVDARWRGILLQPLPDRPPAPIRCSR